MRPDTTDRRTKLQKLLDLAESEKGTPEGELARQRARELFGAGARLVKFTQGQPMTIGGREMVYQGESWPDCDDLPTIHVAPAQPPQIRVIFMGHPSWSTSTAATTTAASTVWWWHNESL